MEAMSKYIVGGCVKVYIYYKVTKSVSKYIL